MKWLEFTVICPLDAQEAVTQVMLRHDVMGVVQRDDSVQGYLPQTSLPDAADALRAEVGQLRTWGLPPATAIRTRWMDEEDWANGWKQYFEPFRLGRRLVIRPSWRAYEAQPGDVVLEMDPGMAFGTGLHPTTALCAEWMEDLVRPGDTVLDVGCGSGILALWAARLGAGRVWACDNDPVAVAVAIDNACRNGLTEQVSPVLADSPADAPMADLVIANIIADVIIPMLPALCARRKPGGRLLLSGIVSHRSPQLLRALSEQGLHHVGIRGQGEWRTYLAAE